MDIDVVNHKIPILIVGATGMLGSCITSYALQNPNLLVSILVRDPSKNPELCSQVKAQGGRVIQADLSKPETLRNVTEGIHTVVSTVFDTNEKISVDGQKALVEDCLKHSVKRYVPSEYGLDTEKFDKKELDISLRHAFKTKFAEYLKTTNLPTLRFNIGIFTNFLLDTLRTMGCYYGDPELKHNLTTIENTARLVVAGVATAGLTGTINYSGGNYTMREIQDIYNKVRGTNVELKFGGYIGELRRLFEEKRKEEGDNSEATRFLASLLIFSDKRSKLHSLDNEAFPDVKEVSLEDFLQENPTIRLEQSDSKIEEGVRANKNEQKMEEEAMPKVQYDI